MAKERHTPRSPTTPIHDKTHPRHGQELRSSDDVGATGIEACTVAVSTVSTLQGHIRVMRNVRLESPKLPAGHRRRASMVRAPGTGSWCSLFDCLEEDDVETA